MSLRPSTAQEILDAEGWVPCGSGRLNEIGAVISTEPNRLGIPTDCKLVIVGYTNIEKVNTLLVRHHHAPARKSEDFPFWYKVVAE